MNGANLPHVGDIYSVCITCLKGDHYPIPQALQGPSTASIGGRGQRAGGKGQVQWGWHTYPVATLFILHSTTTW